MTRTRLTRPRLLFVGAAMLVLISLMAMPLLYGEPEGIPGSPGADRAEMFLRAGPPPCLGYTIDDPCITPKALAECRRAVARCGDEPIVVLFSCPLQFRCGR